LTARQTAVENLQLDRNVPVHVLNELVRQTPEGIYFTAVKQDGQALNVSGIAQTNERVSEFLRNTGNNSDWLYRPELIEIKLSAQPQGSREPRRLYEFSVRLNIKRTQDQAQAAPGAASAASAAGTAAMNKG
jgi:type IV pilus assembly protein PilN